MRFDKDVPKKRRKRKKTAVEEVVSEVPGESIEEKVGEEHVVPAKPAPVVEPEPVVPEKSPYESVTYGKEGEEYTCAPTKKGYCVLRESAKKVFGVKYDATKAPDIDTSAKIKILDWTMVLPRKGDPERKKWIKLLK